MMLVEGEDSKTGIISTIPDDSTLTAQAENQKVKRDKTGNNHKDRKYKSDRRIQM